LFFISSKKQGLFSALVFASEIPTGRQLLNNILFFPLPMWEIRDIF
jgi:hypothetical protein